MKVAKRAGFGFLLAALVCVFAFIVPMQVDAAEILDSGSCGDNVTWVLTDDGVLAVSGTGSMANYSTSSAAPWYKMRSKITTAVIGDGVTRIGDFAFYNIATLTNIDFADSVSVIGKSAFASCTHLKTVNISAGITEINSLAFSECTRLQKFIVDEGNPNYSSDSVGVLFNKAKTKVVQGPPALSGTYKIPEGVTALTGNSFRKCAKLTAVVIPQSVTNIGIRSFEYCTTLKTVIYCGDQQFWSEITIGDASLASKSVLFHEYANNKCKHCGFTGQNIVAGGICGDNLTWNLTSDGCFTVSGTGEMFNNTKLAYTPWYNYRNSITSVVIYDGVTNIGSGAFAKCINLKTVSMADSVTCIGDFAFSGCTNLTAVQLSTALTNIGDGAFSNCKKLSAVDLPQTVTQVENFAFFNCDAITAAKLSDNVTNVGAGVFYSCDGLKSVVLGSGITKIGAYMFCENSSLNSIVIPASVVSASETAFDGCYDLSEAVYCGDISQFKGSEYADVVSTSLRLHSFEDSTCQYCGYSLDGCVASGICGTDLSWEIRSDGTLVVSGTGEMYDYVSMNAPWAAYAENITSVQFASSVTKIGSGAFACCEDLNKVIYCGTKAQWENLPLDTNPVLGTVDVKYHDYADEVCTYCGTKYAPAGTITDTGISLALEGLSYINQYVKITGFEGVDIAANGGLLIWTTPVTEKTAVFGTQSHHMGGLIKEGTEFVQQTNGINSTEYADIFYIRAYVKDAEGNYVYGPVRQSSVREYCEGRINKSGDAKLINTVIAMLHYGAASQLNFGYNTEDLANKNILNTHPRAEWDEGYLDDLVAPNTKITGTDKILDTGKSLSLADAILMNFYIKPEGLGTITTAKMYFWQGVNGELTFRNATKVSDMTKTGSEFVCQSDMIPSADYGETIYVCAYLIDSMGNEYYSNVFTGSPEAYAKNRIEKSTSETLKESCKAFVLYGEAAKIYFGKVDVPSGPAISMRYDDVLDLSAAPYNATQNSNVIVANGKVTSKQVGTDLADVSVLTYDSDAMRLYATAVGTTQIMIDGRLFNVKVEPALISVFLIGGHSVSAGVGGNPAHSVVNMQGQVYSTYESYITEKADENWGWEYNWSFSSATEQQLQTMGIGQFATNRPETIDALVTGNTGTYGSGSALAYEWNKLTGEKVWVINAGHGGMGLSEWREGAMDYVHAVLLFRNAEIVLRNEIEAGHYTLSRMNFFYFSSANGDQTWFTEDYAEAFESMWNGFKRDLAMDFDADGVDETFNAIGLVPHWRPAGASYVQEAFNNGQTYNYFMAASGEYPDVFIASSLCRGFDRNHVSTSAIQAFYPASVLNYQTQDGTDPASLIPTTLKGYEGNSVFPDQIHIAQITQNLQGMIMARSLYDSLYGENAASVTLYKPDGINTIANNATISLSTQEEYRITAMIEPAVKGNLTFEAVGDAITINGTYVTASKTAGTAVLNVKLDGKIIASVNFVVTEPAVIRHMHCICGSTDDAKHNCKEDIIWTAWTSKNSLPTESGYYYLTNDVALTSYANILNGNKVYLCLNGHTVSKSYSSANGWVGRMWQIGYASELTVCDCTGLGSVKGSSTNQNGGLIIVLEGGKLNWYDAALYRDAADTSLTSTTTYGGLIYIYKGAEANVYSGTITGGSATNGANIYAGGVLNMYGSALVTGGNATSGGNVYVAGEMNLYDNASVTLGSATSGGNINVSGGKLNIYDNASVTNGTAHAGGNIYSSSKSSEINIFGGTVSKGVATTSFGGNIYAGCSLNISGGSILNGSGTQGGNIMSNYGQIVISGGNIEGGKSTNDGGNIKAIGGSLTITGGTIAGGNASAYGGNIALGGAADNSAVAFTLSGGTVTGGTASYGGNLAVRKGGLSVTGGTLSNGTLRNVTDKAGGNIYVASGCSAAISGGNITGGNAAGVAGGNIYNLGQLDISVSATITGGTAADGGNICSSGANAVLNITGGTISNGSATNFGGNIYTGGTVHISSGTISGGNASQGGNIMTNNAALTISGGTIENGVSSNDGGNIKAIGCSVSVTGGVLRNGQSNAYGGNIAFGGAADSSAVVFTLNGGAVSGGKAVYGGNIAVRKGSVQMLSGTVSDGLPRNSINNTYGGNIYVCTGTTFTISGGNITGGSANTQGGSIFSEGTLEIAGGTISGGFAPNGGNIYVKSGNFNLSGDSALIKDGTSNSTGGNLFIAGGNVSITAGTVSDGVTGTNGGNMYCENAQVVMTGGSFIGGSGTQGANVQIRSGSFTMRGGILKDGDATGSTASNGWGGNLYVKGTVRLEGTAVIENGFATVNGGNVHVAGEGSFTMDGANVRITGGTITTSAKSNDLNQLQSGSDRTVSLLNGTVGTKVYTTT